MPKLTPVKHIEEALPFLRMIEMRDIVLTSIIAAFLLRNISGRLPYDRKVRLLTPAGNLRMILQDIVTTEEVRVFSSKIISKFQMIKRIARLRIFYDEPSKPLDAVCESVDTHMNDLLNMAYFKRLARG